MALTKNPDTSEEGKEVLAKAVDLFSTINNEIYFKEDCDLFFNMQLHYQFMLNEFGMDVGEVRIEQMKNLQSLADSSKSNQLVK